MFSGQYYYTVSLVWAVSKEVKDILEDQEKESDRKYLGLPSFVGRKKMEVFAYLRERVRNKIKGWKAKLLSRSGKEILLKSVVQSMQTYAMSVLFTTKKFMRRDTEDDECFLVDIVWG